MRTFAIGDIHGGLKALIQVLNKIDVTATDTLIFMGDYVDGWSESAQVIDFLIDLSDKTNCIFIKGNHDVWCKNWLNRKTIDKTWLAHGGKETIASYEGYTDAQKKQHIRFLKKTKKYYIDDENRLFVHAGFTSMHGVKREVYKKSFYFDRTLWEMALIIDKKIDGDSPLYPKRVKHYKEIFIGHTPTTNYGKTRPMQAINIWNVDTGAAFKGSITALNIDTKEFFQSDTLPSLYPNEKGRNK